MASDCFTKTVAPVLPWKLPMLFRALPRFCPWTLLLFGCMSKRSNLQRETTLTRRNNKLEFLPWRCESSKDVDIAVVFVLKPTFHRKTVRLTLSLTYKKTGPAWRRSLSSRHCLPAIGYCKTDVRRTWYVSIPERTSPSSKWHTYMLLSSLVLRDRLLRPVYATCWYDPVDKAILNSTGWQAILLSQKIVFAKPIDALISG